MPSGKIFLLRDAIINQIAAGEVVERPSSVVRELVDNSIDAGANEIIVALVDGGQTSITISDNGCGMSRDDALMSFERHATSKIKQLDDLETLKTKGFRGEALASIASVARVTLTTREEDTDIGTKIFISGGIVSSVEKIPCPVGTEIEVRNLFFNTPARKKFLKSPKYEESKIKDWILQVSLAHPTIRFRVLSDSKEIFSAAPCQDILARTKMLIKNATLAFQYRHDEISIEGLIGHPSAAGGDSKSLVILVNQRVITDRTILRAVKDGYSSSLKSGEFPVGVVSIVLPGQFVDINVNPQKSEVRFASSQKIYIAVRTAVQEAIKDLRSPMQGMTALQNPVGQLGATGGSNVHFTAGRAYTEQHFDSPYTLPLSGMFVLPAEQIEAMTERKFIYSNLQYIGQLFECYLLCEYDESFYVVDMHAAHERINFNRIRNSINSRSKVSQKLLVPLEISLSSLGIENIEQQRELLEELGFTLHLKGNVVSINEIPSLFVDGDIPSIIQEMAEHSEELVADAPIVKLADSIASRLACHASIRSGKIMTKEEAYALFETLDSTECSAACPHGRPCIVSFPESQIERWFGRDR